MFLTSEESLFHVREIVRRVDEEINAVRRELARMEKFGMVTSEWRANRRFYTFRKDYRFYTNRIHIYLLEKLNTPQKSEKENNKLNNANKIEKITIIELKNGRRSVAVNDNYNETREIKDNSESWQIFIKEIKDKNIRPDNRTGVKDISVSMRDYFNYNENCPIYMSGEYALTEIITGRDIRGINPEIKTKIISEKQFSTLQKRKAKQLKTT